MTLHNDRDLLKVLHSYHISSCDNPNGRQLLLTHCSVNSRRGKGKWGQPQIPNLDQQGIITTTADWIELSVTRVFGKLNLRTQSQGQGGDW